MATNKNPGFTLRESKATPFTSTSMGPDVEVMFTLYSMSLNAAINLVLNKFCLPLKSLFPGSGIARQPGLFLHNTHASRSAPVNRSRHERSFRLRWERGL